MGNPYLFGIVIVGFSGLVAQTLLFRELLVTFYGNELILSVILANWVLTEAIGAFAGGRLVERLKNKINVFVILELLFCAAFFSSLYLARTYKNIAGFSFGQAVSLSSVWWGSLAVMLPPSFIHGALFSAGCRLSSAAGKAYAWEAGGAILGGVVFTYWLLPYFHSFQIAFVIAALNLSLCVYFLKHASRLARPAVYICSLILFFLFLVKGADQLQRFSIARQWQGREVLSYRNSVYGNIVVTREKEQHTFFYNGIPVITTPYPDTGFVQEFAHLPLLFHPGPKEVLVVSAGAGGLLNEILKHPIERLDYAELDPALIELLGEYPSTLTEKELSDPRLRVLYADGRFLVRTMRERYDVVLIGLSKPSDLATNRLFTREFFAALKGRLNPGGIVACWLPGSPTHLGRELRDLNAVILNAMKRS